MTKAEWQTICAAHGDRCAYCDAPLFNAAKRPRPTDRTIDHVVAIKHMGPHDVVNVVPACRQCNSKKGTRFWPLLPKHQEIYVDRLRRIGVEAFEQVVQRVPPSSREWAERTLAMCRGMP